MSSVYILAINIFSDTGFANIFSYSVDCLILLTVSFAAQNLNFSQSPNLSIFLLNERFFTFYSAFQFSRVSSMILYNPIITFFFFFCWLCLWCYNQEVIAKSNVPEDFALCFLLQSFIVLGVTFKSLIHLSSFLYMVLDKGDFIFGGRDLFILCNIADSSLISKSFFFPPNLLYL